MRSLTKWSLAVALVGLWLFFNADFAVGSRGPKVPVSVQMGMTPQIPSLGETAEVVATIKAGPELKNAQVFFGSYNGTLNGVELVGTPAVQTISFKPGETKEFRYKIKFVGPKEADVMVGVRVFEVRWGDGTIENFKGLGKEAGYGLKLYEKNSKFYMPYTEPKDDPNADLQKELGLPEEGGESGYWYSVALHLQDDLVRYAQAKGISYEEAKKILKDRAERMSREKHVEKQTAYETILTKRLLWKEAKLPDPFKFKRDPSKSPKQGFLNTPRNRPGVLGYATPVDGYWYYDDHEYNRTQGLLVSPADTLTPVRMCWVKLYDFGSYQNPRGRTLDGTNVTGPTGYFNISADLPVDTEAYRMMVDILAEGPSTSTVWFAVEDSSPGHNIWKYETDTLIVWSGLGASFNNLHLPRYSNPSNLQPVSGAWNIYDCMYRAASSKVGYPSRQVRAKWSPNYLQDTEYNPNTGYIYINGRIPSPVSWDGADEWHDDAIFHEYGHFVYYDWSNTMPWDTNGNKWNGSFPSDTFNAWNEGWANFFSAVVRDSLLNKSWGTADSLYVLTNGKIGGGADSLQYLDLEEPWNFHWFGKTPSDSFAGGPWCVGAVTGSLFDIMDRYNENPYPRHPAVGWPDTAADTLRIKSAGPVSTPYLDVVKNYKINNHSVRTIYDFLSGWMHPPAHPGYSYGHENAIKSILKHHRIPWNRPNAPTNLAASSICTPLHVHLTWNSVSGAIGYNVFRTNYTKLNTNLVSGTSYDDYTVTYSTQYTYYVTSVDSFDNESDYSTGATIKTCNNPGKAAQLSSAVSLVPTVFDLSQNEPNPFSGGTVICYALPRDVRTVLRIYDIQGRLVRSLVDEEQKAAYHQVRWDLKSDAGVVLPAGVYFIRMEAGDFRKTHKLVVVR